jgi:PIN domain nuclease of toxin-antitoxin system
VKFLIDTHCWLWQLSAPERLRPEVLDLLSEPTNEVYLSVASVWELVIKHSLGKLVLPLPPERYVPERMGRLGQLTLPIEQRHVLRVAGLPPHHKDPFDRVLVAQAMADDLTIVTADRAMTMYEARIVWGAV